MKRITIKPAFIAIVLLTTVSCGKEKMEKEVPGQESPAQETPTQPAENNPAVFTASTEYTLTKTALSGNDTDGYDVNWENGDQITIIDGAGNVGVYSTTSTTTTGTFDYESGTEATTGDYTAYYPATIYNGGTPMLPDVQEYAEGNIAGAPMYASSSTTSLQFKNLCGILRLNISTVLPGRKVRRIILSSDLGMSGAISNVATLASDGYVAAVSGTEGLTLDCGSAGVDISSTPTPFLIAVPEGNHTSLSITVETTDGTSHTRISNKGIVVTRSSITDISLSFNKLFVNLSAAGTANTYIVSAAGLYGFDATVKGNGGMDPMTGIKAATIPTASIAGAKVLWELSSQGRVIKYDGAYELLYNNGYVFFSTPDSFLTGVICVAIYDSSDNILWSWNIWSRSMPGTMTHNGKTFMNCNLCAVSENYNRGFLYQWGRKDAFSAATGSYASFTFVPSLLTAFSTVTGIHTMEYTIVNPTVHINNGDANSWMPQEEYEKHPWMDGLKTIYDPSPIGWRVPTSDEQSGMSGLPATGFCNAINEFGNPNSGYYRTSTATTYPSAYAYRQNGERNNWGTNPAFAIRCVVDDSYTPSHTAQEYDYFDLDE